MNIIVIFNNCKSIQNIFDLIIHLSKKNKIYYYLNHQTSRTIYKSEEINLEKDTLNILKQKLKESNCIMLGESQTKQFQSVGNVLYLNECFNKIKNPDYCIIDDSNGLEKGNSQGFNIIYQILKKKFKNIKVIGNIEGIKDFNAKKKGINIPNSQLESISKSLNICYDYINIFSKYQFDILSKNGKLKNKILKCGIPYLDKLKIKNSTNEYLLLFTSSINKNGKWEVMDDKIILKFSKLATKFNLKMIIKEKPRNVFTYKHLENENIIVSMCEGEELDNYIYKSKYIISAPSTVLLRCLVLLKPFLILNDKYYGQLGLFKNYKYLINKFNIEEIEYNFKNFSNEYLKDFLNSNLYGSNSKSIKLFENILNTI